MKGFSLLELLIVIALISIVLVVSSNEWATVEQRMEFEGYADEVYLNLKRCRWRALQQRAYAGGYVEKQESIHYVVNFYQDGNANGIRKADIEEGIDKRYSGPIELTLNGGEMGPGILNNQVPQIPPRPGYLTEIDDPVKFGRSDIISFSPLGDSSSGTLYLHCPRRKEMYAVVVYGATARITLWRYRNQKWQLMEG